MRSIAIILVLTCSGAATASSEKQSNSEVFYCGGETTRAAVELYFVNLRSALAENSPKSRFNQFVADRFGVRDTRGKTLWFDLKDFHSVTPGRIARDEWRQISNRGQDGLEDAGWRGCFLDHGKVWFEADAQSGFKLKSIAKDMPWVASGGDQQL